MTFCASKAEQQTQFLHLKDLIVWYYKLETLKMNNYGTNKRRSDCLSSNAETVWFADSKINRRRNPENENNGFIIKESRLMEES